MKLGQVIPYRAKALIEFEKRALRYITISSQFMNDVPAAIRVARRLNDNDLLARIDAIIIPLSSLADAIEILELSANDIMVELEPMEPVILHVENVGGDHDFRFLAEKRQEVVWISSLDFTQRNWLDKLTNEPPRLSIEYRG